METFGKYALLEQIHSGEVSSIFFARPTKGEGPKNGLILKRLNPLVAEDSQYLNGFLVGAKRVFPLKHESICQVSDCGTMDGHHFLVHDYASGKDLRSVERRHSIQRRLLPQPVSLYLIQTLCDALDHASRTEVHGRLSLSDIILGFHGEVQVLNFGMGDYWIKRASSASIIPKEKAAYLSPDHFSQPTLKATADVFTLGLVLYELLTGTQVFPEGIPSAGQEEALKKLASPSSVRPSVASELDAVVMRALEFDPGKRFATPGELKQAIGSIGELEIGTAEDMGEMMNRIFPNEFIIERERLSLEVPKDLPATPPAVAAALAPVPVPAAVVMPQQPSAGVPTHGPAEDYAEEKSSKKGVWIAAALGIIVIASAGIYLAISSGTSDTALASNAVIAPAEPAEPPPARAPSEAKPAPSATHAASGSIAPTPPVPSPAPDKVEPDKERPKTSRPSRRNRRRSKSRRSRYSPPEPKAIQRPAPAPKPAPVRIPVAPVVRPDPKPMPRPKPTPAPRKTTPSPAPAPQVQMGFLKIIASTPIDVTVDGWKAPTGRKTLSMKLAPGSHSVTVTFRETGKTLKKQIVIKPNKIKKLMLTF